jgi:hypothetical protein
VTSSDLSPPSQVKLSRKLPQVDLTKSTSDLTSRGNTSAMRVEWENWRIRHTLYPKILYVWCIWIENLVGKEIVRGIKIGHISLHPAVLWVSLRRSAPNEGNEKLTKTAMCRYPTVCRLHVNPDCIVGGVWWAVSCWWLEISDVQVCLRWPAYDEQAGGEKRKVLARVMWVVIGSLLF